MAACAAIALGPLPASGGIAFQAAADIRVGSAPTAFALVSLDGPRLIVARDEGLALVGPLDDPLPVATRLAAIQFPKSVAYGPFLRPGAPEVACIAGNEPVVYLFPANGRELGRPIEVPLPAHPHVVRAYPVDRTHTRQLFVVHGAGISVLKSNGGQRRLDPVIKAAFVIDFDVADLNQDESPDVVAAESNDDRLLIVAGTKDGTFQEPQRLATVRGPRAVWIADGNGDRRPDLFVLGRADVAVHLQEAPGTYRTPTMLLTEAQLSDLAAADLDGDAYPDLAMTDPQRGIVTVLMNGGNGAFELRRSYAVGSGASTLLIADVNDDARADILTLNPAADSVTILRGRGDGYFDGALAIVGTTVDFTDMVLADLDADARLDLAATSEHSSSLSIFLGNGAGDFAGLPPLALGGQPRGLVVGELNGDHFPDLAVADLGRDQVILLTGTDRGGFAAPQRIAVGQGPIAVTIGNFRGQGMHDLAVVNTVSDTVSILYGDGHGQFPRIEHFPVTPRPTFLVVGDLNQDRHVDVVVGNDYSNTVSVLKGSESGLGVPSTDRLASSARVPVAEDFDRDGFVDLVLVNEDTATVDILPGRRGGGFGDRVSVPVGHEPKGVATGDINADGRVDVAVLHRTPPTITILLNQSDRGQKAWRQASLTPGR